MISVSTSSLFSKYSDLFSFYFDRGQARADSIKGAAHAFPFLSRRSYAPTLRNALTSLGDGRHHSNAPSIAGTDVPLNPEELQEEERARTDQHTWLSPPV